MRTKTINKNTFFKMFSSMVVISTILALIVFTFYEITLSKESKSKLISEESLAVETLVRIIGNDLKNVVSDLEFMKYELEYEQKDHIEREWANFLKSKKFYDQIRYLDVNGDELIRVNFNDGDVTIVAEEDLQNKRDRYYFSESVVLNDGDIYVSKFDLNMENNQVEVPEKPMLRIALRIHSEDIDGVIIINYLADHLLNDIELFNQRNSGSFYLTNTDNDYLFHGDASRSFRFMYDNHLEGNFEFDYPNVMESFTEGDDYVIVDRNLFILEEIILDDIMDYNDKKIVTRENLRIINHIDGYDNEYYYISVDYLELIKLVIFKNRYSFLIILFASLAISYLQYRIKKSKHVLKELFEKDGLTDIYNRRAGMHYLNLLLEETQDYNQELSVIFIDVDGLKQINDILGHEIGDDLLLSITEIINHEIRDSDLFIRLGGDEFLLVLPNNTDENSEHIMIRINDKIKVINKNPIKKYIMSISYGITNTAKLNTFDAEVLIRESDALMYQHKNEKDRSHMIKQ